MDSRAPRRKYDRVTVFIPIRIFKNGKEAGKGEVEDLSIGGAYIRTAVPVKMGDNVEIEFQFAAMKSVLGTVVEVNEIDEKAPIRAVQKAQIRWDRAGGFGVQFGELSPELSRLLKRLTKYMAQIQKEFATM